MTEKPQIIRRVAAKKTSQTEQLNLFATVPLGAEELTAAELAKLDAGNIKAGRGGVSFTGDRSLLYRALLQLRTASRLLLKLTEFTCSSPQELYDKIYELDWQLLLTPSMTMAVDCSIRDSAMTHSHATALKAKDAVVDKLRDRTGSRPDINTKKPDLRINLHIVKNRCTVSLDASGDPLDRRGWRLDRNEAPLRETLAAAIIMHTGWDGSVPLLDPMCGSGTLLLEAAAMAMQLPAGAERSFGLMQWPDFDKQLWQQVLQQEKAKSLTTLPATIIGYDHDPKAIITCRENARRAGLAHKVSFDRKSFADLEPGAQKGILVMNPPYGVRMGEQAELSALYRKIGEVLKHRFNGWSAYILAADLELVKKVGLKPSRRFVLFNGPLECRLLKYDLY